MKDMRTQCLRIVEAMRQGGYWARVMDAGPALQRLQAYLRAMAGEAPFLRGGPLQYPGYPCFPGLGQRPWHAVEDFAPALQLQQAWPLIRAEYDGLAEADFVRYDPPSMTRLWQVHLLWTMGVDLAPAGDRMPRTRALLRALPGVCLDYPWGDALVSVHAGNSHLAAHCSIDNLRLRLHLGLEVPPGCEIRVGHETRAWQQGRALLFEDSFEHETWNRGPARRAVLIVDFWHPDLSALETEALTAGFRHSSVRQIFVHDRTSQVRGFPPAWQEAVDKGVLQQDESGLVQRWWDPPAEPARAR